MKIKIVLLLTIFLIAGCSSTVKQTVKPFKQANVSNICLIDNPKVKQSFRDVYKSALESKGFTVRIIDKDSNSDACEVTSRYTARWGWDLALYLSYAQLKIFNKGKESGEAVYKVVFVGATGKFINTQEKIYELVSQLFPTN